MVLRSIDINRIAVTGIYMQLMSGSTSTWTEVDGGLGHSLLTRSELG